MYYENRTDTIINNVTNHCLIHNNCGRNILNCTKTKEQKDLYSI